MLDARLLYRAYQITGEFDLGDVTAGIAKAAQDVNHVLEDGEIREYGEFLGRHNNKDCLASVYKEGLEAFEAEFNNCLAEEAAREAAKNEKKGEESE